MARTDTPGVVDEVAERLLADLDFDQRRAVTTGEQLVAVVAGAGSGKTRVLTRRIAYRIVTGQATAKHTLALTFTREAAGELRRRLRHVGVNEHIEAGTFHSVFLGVLKQRWADTGSTVRNVLPDRRRYMVELVGDAGGAAVDGLTREVEWAGALGVDAGTYVAQARAAGRRPQLGFDRTAQLLSDYDRLKRRRGVIDFDDVLALTVREMQRDRQFAAVLQWRFRHLYVDEAQDLNPVQHQLIELLHGSGDVFIVGDPAQAIYGFNGADPSLLLDVEQRFPGVEVIRLPMNHRCTPQVVRTGVHVLRTAAQPIEAQSRRADGPNVEIVAAEDADDEAARVARVAAAADPGLVRTGNVAVLARTNALLTPIQHALTAAGLPVRHVGGAASGPLRTVLGEACAMPSASRLRAWAHDTLDALADRSPVDLSPGVRSRAAHDDDGVRTDVANVVLEFLRGQPLGDGAQLRAWVLGTDPFGTSADGGVELLSFHASKGREWHTVVLVGVETSLVPHKTATTNAARSEEARLLYVACTRATDRLVITHANRRGGYVRRRSPLLDGLELDPVPVVPPPQRSKTPSDPVLDRLLTWRDQRARRAQVAPELVLTDRDVRNVARSRPRSAEELAACTSVGPLTAARLAPEIVAALADP